ncbi:transcriptional regulator [Sphingomonas jinjuensis]|uniref:Transcriptional regulator n=1 Tax=Sphingomonas jinjuensis TaxID=535907 RepID=A0A840FDH0_9SPHN|nr:FMN-binding negative transcriptional regulator [Sphingomonas jinjuensis]MBB4153794.1 transcriptional regulator [Sphingomonas jinjuensis]
MHPDGAFAMDAAAMQALVRDLAFAHLFVSAGGACAVVHAPVTLDDDGNLRFHLARRNRAAALLAGEAHGIASIGGPGFYVSPDWYGTDQQVPTWNYVAVEVEGPIRPLPRDELIAQIDAMSAQHEALLAPKPAWTRDKMDAARFDAMVGAISGHVLVAKTWRGTRKLSQNKPADAVRGVVASLEVDGCVAEATLVAEVNAGKLA